MRLARFLTAGIAVILFVFVPVCAALATPTGSLDREGSEVFDDWRVCRTRCTGEDGFFQELDADSDWPPDSFRPQIVFESLGRYADVACRLGEESAGEYPDKSQRAESIFNYVRDNVRYELDEDQFDLAEFAQNADELAGTIEDDGLAYGDCEDMAILLSVMFYAAGLRSAVVDCSTHAGVIVYLPDYEEANVVFDLDDESGWVWAEATGKNNTFGWFPQGQLDGPFLAYEISAESIESARPTAIAGTPSEFSFTFVLGGANPASQTLAVRNSGQGKLQWSVADDAAWLNLSPASGTCDGEADYVTLSADGSGLAAGMYQARVTITSSNADNSPVNVPVYLNVATSAAAIPAIALLPLEISFKAKLGGRNPAGQTLTIYTTGEGPVPWSVRDDADWLSSSPSSGVSSGESAEVTLSVDVAQVGVGRHETTVTVSSPGALNSPMLIPVRLDVTASGPNIMVWVLVFFIVVVVMFAIVMVGKLRRR